MDIRGLGTTLPPTGVDQKQRIDRAGPTFQDLLKGKVEGGIPSNAVKNLKFSSHAVDRMSSRGIRLQAGDLQRLEAAVEKADQKGSKDTLLLMGESAFIVNVKNRTVITAMDSSMMKENVFTNIDSTIVL